MTTSKTTKTKVSFEENLSKIIDTANTLPTSALYALSNIIPERQTQFEEAWKNLKLDRRRKVVAALNDLAEEVVELNFDSVLNFMMHDPDEEVRAKAVEGLWEDESRQLLGEFLKLIESDPSHFVREKVAIALSRFACLAELGKLPQRWTERLCSTLLDQLINHKNPPEIERRLVEAVGYFNKNDQVIKVIEKSYQSEDVLIKASAIRAMGRNVNPRWIPEIGKEMSNPNPVLRYEAANAAGEMASKELLPTIIKLSADKDREVKLAAIWSLGQIGGPEASRTLKNLLQHDSQAVKNAAQDALSELNFAENPINPLSGEL